MKFTKISSDKAYKLAKDGHGETLYFLDYGCKNYSKFGYLPEFWNYHRTRAYFRAFHCFVGTELPTVTVRQSVELNCTNGGFFIRDDILKMISNEHGEAFTQYPRSENMSKILDNIRERTSIHILFDIDSEGNKINFRFE